jgi:hypothetical protein
MTGTSVKSSLRAVGSIGVSKRAKAANCECAR